MAKKRKTPSNPHVAKAHGYARAVVAGEIHACKWVRLACQRQLNDLERQADETWPYRFDEALAERACVFLEQLPHTQGPLANKGQLLKLEPWQCFITACVYGWVRKDSTAERPVRRFTRVYEEEPRGQGKSLRMSGALLYAFTEKEAGAELYSAAVDREQARKVYDVAEAMLFKAPALMAALGLGTSAVRIVQNRTRSYAQALSKDAKKTGDGKNVYFAVIDELHAHPTREVYDVIDTGTGKRSGNALVWAITTAGFDTSGICYEKRDYLTKVLEGSIEDETLFGIIYTVDDPELWTDDECRNSCDDHSHPRCQWRMANPNWGVSVDPKDFESKMARALNTASERNSILTKHLCVWRSADSAWVDLDAWDKAKDPALTEADFKGEPCFIGVDLASKIDLTAKVKVFVRDEIKNGKTERHAYAFFTTWLPEDAIHASRNASYLGWFEDGQLVAMPGAAISDEPIVEAIEADGTLHRVQEVGHDQWNARQLANVLADRGFTVIAMPQNTATFSEPMKELRAMLLTGRFHHNAPQCVRWQMSNVVAHEGRNDSVFPNKLKPENKIDAAVALLMAMNRALLTPVAQPSIYESRPRFLAFG